jgi:hypothetical protein
MDGMANTRTTPDVTLDQIRNRATIPVWHSTDPSAAGVLGVGRATAYAMAERGELPTLRIASRVVVMVPALLAMLGERPVSTDNQDWKAADLQGHTTSHEPAPGALTARGA